MAVGVFLCVQDDLTLGNMHSVITLYIHTHTLSLLTEAARFIVENYHST